MDGLEATRLLKAEGQPPVRVLILTTFDPDEYIYEALRAGASGFVLRKSPRATFWRQSTWSPTAMRYCRRR
jgi:DNA-binding NarL/FixJ family response regulator